MGLLVAEHALPATAHAQLHALLEHLARHPHAPTTVTRPEVAIDSHIADSLVALALPELRAAGLIADLGSGAGYPALALAAALPQARIVAIDSIAKKTAFIAEAARQADLQNVEALTLRAEEWTAGREACDVITARALAALPVVLEYAAPLLRIGGVAVVWRGRRDPIEEQNGAAAAEALGLELEQPRRVFPFPAATDRHLQIARKRTATPHGFPRRPGIAQKRPLGARKSASTAKTSREPASRAQT